MTSYLPTLLLIGSLYLLAAISPGPNFFIVTQLSLQGDRPRALLLAAGVTLGSTLWATSAILGLAALLHQLGWFSLVLRLAGAAYLVWYGAGLLLGAWRNRPASQLAAQLPQTHLGAFRTGLLTSVTNPKAGVFWTSVFAATLPVAAPVWVYVATVAMIAALSGLWHGSLALVFGTAPAQALFARFRRTLNALCGLALVGMGLRIGLAR